MRLGLLVAQGVACCQANNCDRAQAAGEFAWETGHLLATRGSLHGTECQQTKNDAAQGIKASLHHPAKRYNSSVTLSLV